MSHSLRGPLTDLTVSIMNAANCGSVSHRLSHWIVQAHGDVSRVDAEEMPIDWKRSGTLRVDVFARSPLSLRTL